MNVVVVVVAVGEMAHATSSRQQQLWSMLARHSDDATEDRLPGRPDDLTLVLAIALHLQQRQNWLS